MEDTQADGRSWNPGDEGAAAVVAAAQELSARSANYLALFDARGADIQRAREALVAAQRERALAQIPIDSLAQAGGRGLRVKALKDAGFTHLGQVLALQPWQLTRYPGIGQQSAASLSWAAREVGREVDASLTVRIQVDPPDPASLRLIAALRKDRILNRALKDLEPELRRFSAEVSELIPQASVVLRGWRFRFARKARKQAALSSIDRLAQWQEWSGSEQVAASFAEVDAALEACNEAPSSGDLVADFRRHSAEYYATLDWHDGSASKSAQSGGLPKDLIGRVEAVQLSTELLATRLRRYQHFGAQFCLAQKRVLIGDEMGLGKTLQALAVMAHRKHADHADHFLVICPAAVSINWVREIRRHTELTPILVHGAQRDADWRRWIHDGGVAVTTYDTAKSVVRGSKPAIDVLVVDEAHYAKNPNAQRSQAVRHVAKNAEHVIFLSGTPMQNRIEEFHNLVDVLQPGLRSKLSATSAIAGPKAFQRAAAPVYLRRNVDEVANELPELTETDQWERFTAGDLTRYREAVEARNFMWMRRVAFGSPQSSKVTRLIELATEAHENDHKVIVFSYFRDVLDVVAKTLPGRVFGPLTGSTSSHARQQLVDDFTSETGPATLVAQISAGGEGLNIQAASVVVLCEPQIKPSLEQQAIARARRMGQTKNVQVHRLLVADSVDQRMLEILGRKERLFNTFVRDSHVAQQSLAAKDATDADIGRQIIQIERERLGIAS